MNTQGRMRRTLVAWMAVCCVTLTLSCTALDEDTVLSPEGTTTLIIMVRHAERDEGLDPPLNEEGIIRAQALADELADDGVTAIFYPALTRNRETADPLAEASGATRHEFSEAASLQTKSMANDFVDAVVRDHAGGVVVWIGNTGPEIEDVQSGNLQEIYARLGGSVSPPIRYKSMYRITLHDDEPSWIVMGTYGGTSSLD